MMIRFLATGVVLSVGLIGLSSPAMAASDPGPAVVGADGTVTVNGRTFGPQDGVVVEEGQVAVGGSEIGMSPLARVAPLGSSTSSWGQSYVSSSESWQLRYDGKAYAAGNRYGDKRVIQTCFQYRRDGKNLMAWKCSNASSASGHWVPGSLVKASVWDTLNPVAAKTTFHYSRMLINPNIL